MTARPGSAAIPLAAAVSAVVVAVSVSVLPASADPVPTHDAATAGLCSGQASWTLVADRDGEGRIVVTGTVAGAMPKRAWRWVLKHNGQVSASGWRVAARSANSLTVTRTVVDLDGPDQLGFRARQPRSGQVCRGGIVL